MTCGAQNCRETILATKENILVNHNYDLKDWDTNS